MSSRRTPVILVTVMFVIVAVLIAVAVYANRNSVSRAEQCRLDGGVVKTEPERKKVNGKWKTEIENECIKDGVELYEW